MALANSKALELAGINKNTKVPAGGEMRKDAKADEKLNEYDRKMLQQQHEHDRIMN